MSIVLQFDEQAAAIAADQGLAKDIARVLAHHYPAPHAWAVHVSSRTGIATIENLNLSETHGFILKLRDLDGPEAIRRAAIKAGGEFLERHDMSRTKTPDRDDLAIRARRARFT